MPTHRVHHLPFFEASTVARNLRLLSIYVSNPLSCFCGRVRDSFLFIDAPLPLLADGFGGASKTAKPGTLLQSVAIRRPRRRAKLTMDNQSDIPLPKQPPSRISQQRQQPASPAISICSRVFAEHRYLAPPRFLSERFETVP